MTVALRTEGHDVLEVSDGLGLLYQALFGWRDVFDKPDVIVSEMRLAGGWNGFDMMDWLRGAAVETPYVFLTESGDATGCSEALRRGAGVLTKPIDLGGLCEMVRRETTR